MSAYSYYANNYTVTLEHQGMQAITTQAWGGQENSNKALNVYLTGI